MVFAAIIHSGITWGARRVLGICNRRCVHCVSHDVHWIRSTLIDDGDRDIRGRAITPRERPPVRARTAGIPRPIDSEESIPVYVPLLTPPPPPGSRVRHYNTPAEYAEADQRRMERLIDRSIGPLTKSLDDFTRWSRSVDDRWANTRLEDHQRLIRLEESVSSIKGNASLVAESKRHLGRLFWGAVIGATVALVFSTYIKPLL